MMITKPDPTIHGYDRYEQAKERRASMALFALQNGYIDSVMSNKEEDIFFETQLTSFTKGLPHNVYGLADRVHYDEFVSAINEPDLGFDVQCGDTGAFAHRGWDGPLAGHAYDATGPDADGVLLPPAPMFGKSEQTGEMAVVYAMALLRDVSFVDLGDPATPIGKVFPDWHPRAHQEVTVGDIVIDLQKLAWFDPDATPIYANGPGDHKASPAELARRAANWDDTGQLTINRLFRGSTFGAQQGHYLSQFLLMGTDGLGGSHTPQDGRIAFGGQMMDQKIQQTAPQSDHMQTWADWLLVQQGADVTDTDVDGHRAPAWTGKTRFVTTLRDLADHTGLGQPQQAFVNACQILLTQRAAFDPGLSAHASRHGKTSAGSAFVAGPQIMNLISEAATRGLNAARRQMFQIHRRARPEAIAARLTLRANDPTNAAGYEDHAIKAITAMFSDLGQDSDHHGLLLSLVAQHNASAGDQTVGDVFIPGARNYLLAMASPDGSPMHPSYGGAHAAVSGACATILKAMFDQNAEWVDLAGIENGFVPSPDGQTLCTRTLALAPGTTIGHEIDKLAANVGLGRNMAGDQFHSDYFDSLRMGERIAVGLLSETMLTFPHHVEVAFTTFDGDDITLSTNGGASATDIKTSINGDTSRQAHRDWWWRYYTPALMAIAA